MQMMYNSVMTVWWSYLGRERGKASRLYFHVKTTSADRVNQRVLSNRTGLWLAKRTDIEGWNSR